MSMQKTIVLEEKDRFRIVRNEDYEPMEEFAQTDPEFPSIRVTPGFNPAKNPPMVPVIVDYGKDLGNIEHIITETIPAIIEKEASCPICKEAQRRMAQQPRAVPPPEPTPVSPEPAHTPSEGRVLARGKLLPEQGILMDMFKKRTRLRDMILPKDGL